MHALGALARWSFGLGLLAIGSGATVLGRTSLSPSGWGWICFAAALAYVALWPLSAARRRRFSGAVALAFALFVVARVVPRATGSRAQVLSLLRDGSTAAAPVVDRLFEERDAAMVGSRLFTLASVVRAREFPRLAELAEPAYAELDATTPVGASPVVSSLLGLESSQRSTTVVVRPDPAAPPSRLGVIFLHGYGGNFVLQCGVVARALPQALTVCPSVSFAGDWWSADGERTVEAARRYLLARGAERLVLAGLSNGAAGAALLLPRVGGRFDAAVLISGVATEAKGPGIPTLLIQGKSDGMMRTGAVRAWVAEHPSPLLHYVELPGTHFVLLEQERPVAEALRTFVSSATSGERRIGARAGLASTSERLPMRLEERPSE